MSTQEISGEHPGISRTRRPERWLHHEIYFRNVYLLRGWFSLIISEMFVIYSNGRCWTMRLALPYHPLISSSPPNWRRNGWRTARTSTFRFPKPRIEAQWKVTVSTEYLQYYILRLVFSVVKALSKYFIFTNIYKKHIFTVSGRPCSFFLEGHCRRSDCKFSHDLSTITCRFWEEGCCFKGITCPFLHGYPLSSEESDQDGSNTICILPSLNREVDFPGLSAEKNNEALDDSDNDKMKVRKLNHKLKKKRRKSSGQSHQLKNKGWTFFTSFLVAI